MTAFGVTRIACALSLSKVSRSYIESTVICLLRESSHGLRFGSVRGETNFQIPKEMSHNLGKLWFLTCTSIRMKRGFWTKRAQANPGFIIAVNLHILRKENH